MSMLPYFLIRPLLFRFDPETTHEGVLYLLEKTQHCSWLWRSARLAHQGPSIKVAGLQWAHRIGLAAGLDKNARCIDAWQHMGLAFAEVGTVTPLPQVGNPRPRLFRIPQAQALINRFGFNNEGLAVFIAHIQRSRWSQSRTNKAMRLGANIGKNASTPLEEAPSDYVKGLRAVWPHVDYVTVNISSPNTQHLRDLQHDQALDQLLQRLEQERQDLVTQYGGVHRPIFIKIAPDLDEKQVASIVRLMKKYGANENGVANQCWGLIACNTTLDKSSVEGLSYAKETGGLSGRPLRERSTEMIRHLRQALGRDFPIIAVGGVMTGQDALEKIQAGADLVQVYTGLIYQGPSLIQDCISACQAHQGAQDA